MEGRETPEEIEATVQAYLDGALTAREMTAVDALLERSGAARAAFERLSRETAGLKALFDAEAEDMARARPILLPEESAAPAPPRRRRDGRRAPFGGASHWAKPASFGAAAGFALGALAGAVLLAEEAPPPEAPGWRMSAAVYQRLYEPETFASAPVDAAGVAGGLAQVGEALSINLSDLETPEGLTLQRAQLLSFNGQPLGQIAFVDENGAAIALCVFARPAPGAEGVTPLRTSVLLDMNAVDWSAGGHDFLLLGPASDEDLRRYGAFFLGQLS